MNIDDNKKILKDKLRPHNDKLKFIIASGAVCLICLLLIIIIGKTDPSRAVAFNGAEDVNTYVYLDIEKVYEECIISNKDETEEWYVVIGADGLWYIAQISDRDMELLTTQIENWNNQVENGESYRLYGTACYNSEIVDLVQESFDYSSVEEVYTYLGKNYIDTTDNPFDYKRNRAIIVFIISAIVLIRYTSAYLKDDKNFIRMIDALVSDEDSKEILQEILNCEPFKNEYEYVLGEKVLIGNRMAMPYKNIIYAYPRTRIYSFLYTVHYVVIKDCFGNEMNVAFKKKDESMTKLINDLHEKNNNISI